MKDPVKDLRIAYAPLGDISQYFGENPALYSQPPLLLKGHNGIDIVRPWAERLYAVESGTVVEVKEDPSGYGRHIRIINDAVTHEWTYGHLSAFVVKVGQHVNEGDLVAAMGNTGFVVSGDTQYWPKGANITSGTDHPGTHLHFGLRIVEEDKKNGWQYNQNTPKFVVINYGNGYKGAVDPIPYLRDPKKLSTRCEKLGTAYALKLSVALRNKGL